MLILLEIVVPVLDMSSILYTGLTGFIPSHDNGKDGVLLRWTICEDE